MKKVLMACAISASFLLLSACGGSGDNETVAKTSSGDIKKEEFYEALKDKHGEEVLYNLVITEVLSSKFEVDEDEIDEEVDSFKDQLGEQFDMWLMQEGIADEDELREILKLSMLQEEAVTSDIEVTDEEIEEYYNEMKVEKEARHILVEDEELADDL